MAGAKVIPIAGVWWRLAYAQAQETPGESMRRLRALLCLLASLASASAAALPPPAKLPYGSEPRQFGLLHLPEGKGPHPVLVLIHGGCWQSRIAGHEYLKPLATALAGSGWAVWNIEYRGSDDSGGGWPGTFSDVAAAVDQLWRLAPEHSLDLKRLVFAGHSAGGHLALWAGSRQRLPAGSVLTAASPLLPRGIIGLAAIPDLERYPHDNPACGAAIRDLVGDAPMSEVSPLRMIPAAGAVSLVIGDGDRIVPASQAEGYLRAARSRGASVGIRRIAGDHFALAEPEGAALKAILSSLRELAPR